jgi:uncharacterized membrane protein
MEFFKFLKGALSETPTEPSSMRVNVFYIVMALVTVIAIGFLITVIFYKELTIAYLGIITGLVVTALGEKVWQRGKENQTPTEVKNDAVQQ